MIVTPDSVRAIVEVKTSLDSPSKIKEAIKKLATAKALCLGTRRETHRSHVWAGLFVYDSPEDRDLLLLQTVAEALNETKAVIDGIAFGPDRVVKHFFLETVSGSEARSYWQTGVAPNLAATVFIGGMLEAVGDVSYSSDTSAWYPADPDGQHTFYLREGDKEPRPGFPKW